MEKRGKGNSILERVPLRFRLKNLNDIGRSKRLDSRGVNKMCSHRQKLKKTKREEGDQTLLKEKVKGG